MTTSELPTPSAQVIDELQQFIRRHVAASFLSGAEIVEAAGDYFAGECDPAFLAAHARRMTRNALSVQLAQQVTWLAPTDCDRLEAAFAELERRGIVCREHFSCCQTCGSHEIWDELAAAAEQGRTVRGYCFYHEQDTERAVELGVLMLSYGAVEAGEAAAVAIADQIVAALRHEGLQVTWNGRWEQRIAVSLEWRRRRHLQLVRSA